MKSDSIGKLVEALSKAQAQIKTAGKTGKNPRFNSTYSTVEDIWNACRKPLSDNSLAVTQILESHDNNHYLTTLLMHTSNEWIESKMPLFLPKLDSQTLGSAITYAKKYSLAAMLGIASSDDDVDDVDNDDDGEGCRASEKTKSKKQVELHTISKEQAVAVKEFLKTDGEMKGKIVNLLNTHNIKDLMKIPLALFKKIEPLMDDHKQELVLGDR